MPTKSPLVPNKSQFWIAILSTLLFLIGMLIAIANKQYWVWLIPPAAFVVFLALNKLDWLLLGVYFIVPLSIVLDNNEFGVSFALPSEPLLFGILLVFLFKLIFEGNLDFAIIKHPVVISILAYFAWMFITTITSSMPLTSLKFTLSHIWGVVAYILLGSQLFKKYRTTHLALWLFITGFSIVIGYVLIRHAGRGFSIADSSKVLYPFMWNHGVYGAVLAFLIPYLLIYSLKGRFFKYDKSLIPVASLLVFLWSVGLFFSYTRAAWLGLFAASGFFILLYFRIRFRSMLFILCLLGIGAFFAKDSLLKKLEGNNKTSNKELGAHLKSIGNVKNDVSNLERVNRWSSGYRMLQERPWLGWGPGTYMFQYAPFQKPWEKTPISTNSGEVGSIHSEFFGPLVEMGIFGMLLFLLFNLTAIYTGLQLFYHGNNDSVRLLSLAMVLGLITYLVHGLVNNFLDWDKTSLLYWTSFGVIVSLSVYHNKPIIESEKTTKLNHQ